ncbi:MAG: alpha-L-rhamnosidase C-terminal domain-containing protein [Ginsengibacter sp.]
MRETAVLRQSDNSVAFKNIVIRPEPVGNITSSKATYQSAYGLIASVWKKETQLFKLKVTIPANTSVTIYLPADASSVIKEGNASIRNRNDIKLAGYEKGKTPVKVGSGRYTFMLNIPHSEAWINLY